MKKVVGLFSCFLFAFSLASCSLPAQVVESADGQDMIGQYQTVSVLLTQTSQAGSETVVPRAPAPARTIGFTAQPPIATLTYTPVALLTETTAVPTLLNRLAVEPCDLARAGMPFDVSVPDDTLVRPGEYFSKTWRLVNAGSCTWDLGYAVVWFSGDELGLNRIQAFNSVVVPGQSVDITVDMQAPETPGVYQSNWKLRNNQGGLFGIGPGGSAPIWARIVVFPVSTETATITPLPPTNTPIPQIYLSGTVNVVLDTGLDLDSGTLNQAANDDVRMQLTEQGQAQLLPANGAHLAWFGMVAPEFTGCAAFPLNTDPVALDGIPLGTYLCFRTTEGLPGWVALKAYDPAQQLITLEFITWAVP